MRGVLHVTVIFVKSSKLDCQALSPASSASFASLMKLNVKVSIYEMMPASDRDRDRLAENERLAAPREKRSGALDGF